MNLNLPPAVWLVIWLGSTAVCCMLVAWLFFQLGWDHCDRDMARHRYKRGADPDAPSLPVAGRLSPLPELDPFPGWSFFGGAQVEPQPGADEYKLMVRQAADTRDGSTGETADEFIIRQALETDELIGRLEAETNYLIHTMRARLS